MPTSSFPPSVFGSALRVLILDDERYDRHRLARLCSGLERPTKVTNAKTLAEFDRHLEAEVFDLILVDYQLPDGTGLDALELVHMSARNLKAAMLMVTGRATDSIAAAALKGGCSDYLTKDELSPDTFYRAVTNALQKSVLTIEVEAQSFHRAEVENVLEHFAGQCARDIKPMLSRMMRQLRDLRAEIANGEGDTSSQLERIESSCTTMWEFTVDLERYQGEDMIAKTLRDADNHMPFSATTQNKPPSPFARKSH